MAELWCFSLLVAAGGFRHWIIANLSSRHVPSICWPASNGYDQQYQPHYASPSKECINYKHAPCIVGFALDAYKCWQVVQANSQQDKDDYSDFHIISPKQFDMR